MKSPLIGLDVGATKVLVAAVEPEGTVVDTAIAPSPQEFNELLKLCNALVNRFRPFEHCGVSVAGTVTDQGIVRSAPNIPCLTGASQSELSERLDCAVTLENDANAAALAEWHLGSLSNGIREDAAAIAIGTGIGCGIILGGKLLRGPSGGAGGVGHIPLGPPGRRCSCGRDGCWELASGGRAFQGLLREHNIADGATAVALWERGDAGAQQLFAEYGDQVARGIVTLASLLDLHHFVLTGGVSELGEPLVNSVMTAVHQRWDATGRKWDRTIRIGRFAARASAVGAALFLHSRDSDQTHRFGPVRS